MPDHAPKDKKKLEAPAPSATPEERRKLTVLVTLGAVIVILVFVASMPFAIDKGEEDPIGMLFGSIGDGISTGVNALGDVRDAATTSDEIEKEEPTQ